MTRGYQILHSLESVRDYSRLLARDVASASVDCPDAIERNLPHIQDTLAKIYDQLAIVEAKIKPREVTDAKAA